MGATNFASTKHNVTAKSLNVKLKDDTAGNF